MNTKIKVGIVGGAGITGGELIRLLLNHPAVELGFVHSRSHAGKPLYTAHADLVGETTFSFTDKISPVDVVFLCLGHGESADFVDKNDFDKSVKIIDLTQDFRNTPQSKSGRSFVYGLPELQRSAIRQADSIANPGCFATAIQLALLPLAAAGHLLEDVNVSAVTGSTGAGQKLTETNAFTWRNNNISVYKALNHQHLIEINRHLKFVQPTFDKNIHFIPFRGNFTRGILASVYLKTTLTEVEAKELYAKYYQEHPFTHLIEGEVDLKLVVNTNKCFLSIQKVGDTLLIISAIDNLLKGASGQAVQNMNIMFGLDETTGLKVKGVVF